MDISAEPYRTLARLEESLWRAEARWDRALMEETFAADFFEFGRSGTVWQRNDMFQDETGEIAVTLPFPNLRIILLDETTALVTYDSVVAKAEIEHARRSSIWSWQHNRWRLRFHQGTPYRPDDQKAH